MDLKKLGFDSWFEEKFNHFSKKIYQPARISAVNLLVDPEITIEKE